MQQRRGKWPRQLLQQQEATKMKTSILIIAGKRTTNDSVVRDLQRAVCMHVLHTR